MKDINHYRKLIRRYRDEMKGLDWGDPYSFGYYLYLKDAIRMCEYELYRLGVR